MTQTRRGGLVAAGVLALAACQPGVSSAPAPMVDRAAVAAATSPAELQALGAQQMDAAQLATDWVGDTHDAGDWVFTINADGTWTAAATDGSWSEGPGTWQITDNQFCREGPETTPECQTLYRIGDYIRVSPDGLTLRDWTITL